MFDKSLIKIISISSFIVGVIIGIIPLIPSLMWLALLLITLSVAPFIIIYLKKLKLIETVEIDKSMIMGALSGTVSFLGFSVVYFPIAFILNLIFKIQSFLWVKVVITNLGFLIPMIILTALLCGLINAFSGFMTAYIYEYIQQRNRG